MYNKNCLTPSNTQQRMPVFYNPLKLMLQANLFYSNWFLALHLKI